jgi:hypothetical protein
MSSLLPELPRIRAPLDDGMVAALQRFCQQVIGLLSGGLTVERNMRAQWLDTVITLPTTRDPAIETRPRLTRRPLAVILVDLRTIGATSAPASLPDTLRWDYDDGKIVLPQFNQPAGTGAYAVRLLVVEV